MWVVREREIICWSKSLCQIVTIHIFLSGGCFLSAISSTCKCVSLWQSIYSLCGSLNLLPLVNIHVMFITEAHSRWPLLPFWHTETPPATLLSGSRGTLVQEISFNHWSWLKCQATNCSEFISRLTRTGKPIGRGCYYPPPSSSYILNCGQCLPQIVKELHFLFFCWRDEGFAITGSDFIRVTLH